MLLFLLMIQRNYKIKNEQKVPQKAVIIKKFQKITTKRVISFCTIIMPKIHKNNSMILRKRIVAVQKFTSRVYYKFMPNLYDNKKNNPILFIMINS